VNVVPSFPGISCGIFGDGDEQSRNGLLVTQAIFSGTRVLSRITLLGRRLCQATWGGKQQCLPQCSLADREGGVIISEESYFGICLQYAGRQGRVRASRVIA